MAEGNSQHIHLDPIGGIAGDMFVACLLDTWPDLYPIVQEQLQASTIGKLVTLEMEASNDKGLNGTQVRIFPATEEAHSHRSYSDILQILHSSGLSDSVINHACGVFSLLADAEAKVHGVPKENVSFHEVGAWDSITDIALAAILIDELDASWSCSPLPLGCGIVQSAHGPLPIPAPATVELLKGFITRSDGLPGERVTPTGAALMKYLNPKQGFPERQMKLGQSGLGIGSKRFAGIGNVLRAVQFSFVQDRNNHEQIAEVKFEVDDQTPEDLAVALHTIRELKGVLDVTQCPVFGKKGRLTTHVQILCKPSAVELVMNTCFRETTTLGLRWQVLNRTALHRESVCREIDGHTFRIKRANRPGLGPTEKVEMDDLTRHAEDRSGRERLRERAQKDPGE